MKVGELIELLKTFDPELPVALADWNEQYSEPDLEVSKHCYLGATKVWDEDAGDFKEVSCVVLGDADKRRKKE